MKRTVLALMALLLLLSWTVGCYRAPTKVKVEPGDTEQKLDPQPKTENPNPEKSKKAG